MFDLINSTWIYDIKENNKSLINGMVYTCVNIFTVKNTLQIKGNNSYMCVYTDIHNICIHEYDCSGKLRACHVGLVVRLSHGRSWVCAPARSYTCDDIYVWFNLFYKFCNTSTDHADTDNIILVTNFSEPCHFSHSMSY